jgi:exopolyphosphatase/guanosine-5'-triphosphate,3'-diphosphate pyrophosphatase
MMDGATASGAQDGAQSRKSRAPARGDAGVRQRERQLYGALDLGTNNCRLLIATPAAGGFRVVDAFSRIVRLGEGLAETGLLSEAAMDRAVAALKVCAGKLRRRPVVRTRCIATEACRSASNGEVFLERVKAETGLALEIISPREEAGLSVAGCLSLIDRDMPLALVVDIGGGSTELSWIDVEALRAREASGQGGPPPVVAWASAPVGVVTVAERFPEIDDQASVYEMMKAHVRSVLPEPQGAEALKPRFAAGHAHIVGSSGTITSLASVHLDLVRYERAKVDGVWMSRAETEAACVRLKSLPKAERAKQPCIGAERADVVLAGCAILEAILEVWPAERLRVADRGLREGMLLTLMQEPSRKRRRRRRRGRRRGGGAGAGAGAPNGGGHD